MWVLALVLVTLYVETTQVGAVYPAAVAALSSVPPIVAKPVTPKEIAALAP